MRASRLTGRWRRARVRANGAAPCGIANPSRRPCRTPAGAQGTPSPGAQPSTPWPHPAIKPRSPRQQPGLKAGSRFSRWRKSHPSITPLRRIHLTLANILTPPGCQRPSWQGGQHWHPLNQTLCLAFQSDQISESCRHIFSEYIRIFYEDREAL